MKARRPFARATGKKVLHLLRHPRRVPAAILRRARLAARALVAARRSASLPRLAPVAFPPPVPRRPDLRVATILDEFSQLAFQYEFQTVPLPRKDWRAVLDRESPAFLFVESAWSGNSGEWRLAFSGSAAPKPDVLEMLEYCRARQIPTVFWNKEDPLEYDRFLRTARHFDWVFTVDHNCVERYRKDLGHDRVGVLPFAVQPKIHNPVDGFRNRTEEVAFAGTYYSGKYPQRQQQMDYVLRPAVKHGLHIYSRHESIPKYQFPDGLRECVVGSLDYAHMLAAYKRYKVFLNVNSVVDSPTMFSRRVLELLACGTPIVSGPSPGMAALLGSDVVAETTDPETTALSIRALLRSKELRDRRAVRGIRAVMDGNTYSDRVNALLEQLGLEPSISAPRISIVAPTNRPGSYEHIINSAGTQTLRPSQLVIGLHGIDEDADQVRAQAESAGIADTIVLRLPADMSLGHVLNELVDATHGDYVARIDDDDFYGPQYLSDQVRAFDYTDAGVVGKWSRFVLMEDVPCLGVLFPGKEHRYTELVGGATLMVRRRVFDSIRFADRSTGEDTQFLRDCTKLGARIYSTDRFNYVIGRKGDAAKHTWRPHPLHILANTEVVSFGSSLEHAFV